jgi:hypothetical protein
VVIRQRWRGAELVREPYLKADDRMLWWNNPGLEQMLGRSPLLLFCGVREYERLVDPGPDAYYAEQVRLAKERAPA